MGTSSQYCLRWNNHRNNLLAAFDQLLHVESFTDVTLACEEGVTLHAHRLVLAACSPYFHQLFVTTSASSKHPIVVLKDVRGVEMRALLEYMYRGEVNVEHDALQGLLKVAEGLKVKGLVEELSNEAPSSHRPTPDPHPAQPPTPTRPPSSTEREGREPAPRSRHEPPLIPQSAIPSSLDPVCSPTHPPLHFPLHSPAPPPTHRLQVRPDLRDLRDLRDPREFQRDSRDHHEFRDFRDLRDPRELRNPLDIRELTRDIRCAEDSPRPPLTMGGVPLLNLSCPDSPPHKRKRPMLSEPLLSPATAPLLRTALAHTHGFPGGDVAPLVSLASSMMPLPLPAIFSSQLLPHEHREHLENFALMNKKEQHDDDSRSFSDVSRDENDLQEKIKMEMLPNGPMLPDFTPYHIDPNGSSSHYSNFVSYVPTPKPEWKRYKQYTKNDLMEAIEAVKSGMTALQASRKYKVPSRTLYDKIKKMGISTLPRRLPSKKSSSGTDLEGGPADLHLHRDPRDPYEGGPEGLMHRERHMSKGGNSDDEDGSTQGTPTLEEEEEMRYNNPPMMSQQTLNSLALFHSLGRSKFYMENGGAGGGESSSTPLDLTDSESSSMLSKRPEIEERA